MIDFCLFFSGDYLQIELPDTITLKRVAVEGRTPSNNADQWVTTYTLSTSMNGTDWVDYQEAGVVRVSDTQFRPNSLGATPGPPL